MKNLSQEYLKECFDYNEITGELLKRPRPRHHFKNNRNYMISLSQLHTPNISVSDSGYVRVSLDNKIFYAHRIIWKMQTGEDPYIIDHIDHNRLNNTWSNLRNIQRKDPSKNLGKSIKNKSGITGVYFNKSIKKWVAQCRANGHQRYIGSYLDINDAAQAVLEFRMKHGFHKNHGQEIREARGRWK